MTEEEERQAADAAHIAAAEANKNAEYVDLWKESREKARLEKPKTTKRRVLRGVNYGNGSISRENR